MALADGACSKTHDDLAIAFGNGVGRVNGRRDRMGYLFDRDDVLEKTG